MKSIITNSIAVIGLLALAFVGYYLFVAERNSTIQNSSVDASDTFASNQIFVKQLSDLQTINLDTSLFQDNRFRSLKNYQSPLERVPAGRSEPFREN